VRDPYQVIERPLLTEKAMDMSLAGKYTFRVDKEANKIEIAEAIQRIYNVHVAKVNTISVKGKKKRVGRFPEGKSADWK
jgi:large subunit ribosomal protein L23